MCVNGGSQWESELLHERVRVVMSNKGLDRSKDRLVKVSVEIPTFGTSEQGEQTAERACQTLAVSFQTTLSGKYKGKTFTYNAKGNRVPDESESTEET
jgi:hypothetical protein